MVVVAVALMAVAVLTAVVVLAMGKGGELATARPDHPPLPFAENQVLTAADVTGLRLPIGLCGYHPGTTDEALRWFAHALTERDRRIANLEVQLGELRHATPHQTEEPLRWDLPGEPRDPWETPADPHARSGHASTSEAAAYEPTYESAYEPAYEPAYESGYESGYESTYELTPASEPYGEHHIARDNSAQLEERDQYR